MYREEINSSPLLYSGESSMLPFWSNFVEFNGFNDLKNYSGNFSQLLDFYLEVCMRIILNLINIETFTGTMMYYD